LHPFGVLESELGAVEDTKVQLRAILADNNFTCQPYSEALIRSIPTNLLTPGNLKREIESNSRRDLRTSRQCITIMDEDGGFLENALSITQIDDATFEVGLHVADITAFVSADSALDKEARSRGIDIYHTISENVPLWPECLRQEWTDLVEGQDRLAFSVIWTISNTGEVCDTWYGKTVMK
jgi:exoribonuclease R